jgi:hypothetical protein
MGKDAVKACQVDPRLGQSPPRKQPECCGCQAGEAGGKKVLLHDAQNLAHRGRASVDLLFGRLPGSVPEGVKTWSVPLYADFGPEGFLTE